MKKTILYILLSISSVMCLYAQKNDFISIGSGFIESGVQYNGLVTPYNPYPVWQFYTNTSQKISISGVPLTMQGGFTNLLFNAPGSVWYPNYLKFSYNKNSFQKELQDRYIRMLEQKAVSEFEKLQKRNQNTLKLQQLQQWLAQTDTNKIQHEIDSLHQLINQGKQIKENTNELRRRQIKIKQIRILYRKQTQLLRENQQLKVNDSIISALETAQTQAINFKTPKMVSLMQMSQFQQMMYSLDEMQAGRFYLDINGISQYTNIDGLQVKIKPRHFFVQAVAGKIFQSNYYNVMFPDALNKNNTYVIGTSIGKEKGKQKIALHYYYFNANASSVNQIRNTIMGAEWQSQLGEKGNLGVLLTGSQSYNAYALQDTIQFQGIPIIYPVSIQNTTTDIINQSKSVLYQTGYRLEVRSEWQGIIKKEHWKIKYERVSPFYQSMAMPFLWRDQQGLELQSRWNLFRNIWKIQAKIEYKEDNISRLKPVSTFWNIAGIQLTKQRGIWKSKTSYHLILRHNTNIQTNYQNVSQSFLWEGKGSWQARHSISGNILWNDTTFVSQQYLYQISLRPAKHWTTSATQGISIIYNTEYLNFRITPAMQKNNYSIGVTYSIMANNKEQHHNITALFDWKISQKVQLYIESGYGRAPMWQYESNTLNFVNYWNGLISLRYNWK